MIGEIRDYELNKVLWYLLLFFALIILVSLLVIFRRDIRELISLRTGRDKTEQVEYEYKVIEVEAIGSKQLVVYGNLKSPYSRFGNYYLPVEVNGYEINLFLGDENRSIIYEETMHQGDREVRTKSVDEVVGILNEKSVNMYAQITIPVDSKEFLENFSKQGDCGEACQQEVELALRHWKDNYKLLSLLKNNKPIYKKLTVGPVGNIYVQ